MRRRDFLTALAASALLSTSEGLSQVSSRRPRLLISETDPFTGLALLRTRYAAGMRPSQDMEGWALSWLLTRQESFAEQALAAMRSGHVAKGAKPSRSWVDYARWSLAFDWLSGYPGFEPALQDRVAAELMVRCGSTAGDCRLFRSKPVLLPQLQPALSRFADICLCGA